MSTHLERALTALSDNRPDELRNALIAAWKQRRSPRLAKLVDLLDQRWPDELPATLEKIVGPRVADSFERLRKLDTLDDPRLSRFAIDSLAHPPFTAPTAEEFLAHLVKTIVRLRDSRLAGRAKEIREVLRVRLTRAPMRDALIEQVSDAVATIADRAPGEPDAAEKALEDELVRRLEPLGAAAATAEGFLAAIYANPADDTPRLVYADWLLERNDPRGELITLQFRRRDGQSSPAELAREQALLKRHGRAWLGALAPVISFGKGYSRSTFERGFLSVADIILSVGKKLEPLWTNPAWATVERLEGSWPTELLERAPLRGLKSIQRRLDASSIRKLPRENLRAIETLELISLDGISRELLAVTFPALRSIELLLEKPALADVQHAASLGVHLVTVHQWVRDDDDAHRRFEETLRAIEGTAATAGELRLTPPYKKWPRPGPVVLLNRDGRWARAS